MEDQTAYNSQLRYQAGLTDMRTAEIRTFSTGATRSSAEGKPEYAGYLSPRFIRAYGQYMLKHQVQADGNMRDCRNWQNGIPLESYMQSMFRHFVEVWTYHELLRKGQTVSPDDFIESLCALTFNAMGMCHELLGVEP